MLGPSLRMKKKKREYTPIPAEDYPPAQNVTMTVKFHNYTLQYDQDQDSMRGSRGGGGCMGSGPHSPGKSA